MVYFIQTFGSTTEIQLSLQLPVAQDRVFQKFQTLLIFSSFFHLTKSAEGETPILWLPDAKN